MEFRADCEDYTIVYANVDEESTLYTEPELITELVENDIFKTRAEALKYLRTHWETEGYYEVPISDSIYNALKKTYG